MHAPKSCALLIYLLVESLKSLFVIILLFHLKINEIRNWFLWNSLCFLYLFHRFICWCNIYIHRAWGRSIWRRFMVNYSSYTHAIHCDNDYLVSFKVHVDWPWTFTSKLWKLIGHWLNVLCSSRALWNSSSNFLSIWLKRIKMTEQLNEGKYRIFKKCPKIYAESLWKHLQKMQLCEASQVSPLFYLQMMCCKNGSSLSLGK